MDTPLFDDVPGGRPTTRVILVTALGTLARLTAVLAIYFLIPMDHTMSAATVMGLTLGVLALCGIVAWQLREITHSDYPGLRAVQAFAFTLPLFILLFATAYFLMEHGQAASFTQPLSRFDALYFSVTIFSTVGFGDITAVSQAARLVVTAQMVLNLIVLGFVLRMVSRAVRTALNRRSP
ncbi:potassium channel family protein [Streptomyces lavendulae]|uniref:potassium channel family protein n=1 Tax=Streptomyces lavendulae TaxID=1914 RepID=UPI0033F291FF